MSMISAVSVSQSPEDDMIPLAQTGYYSSKDNLSAEKSFLQNLMSLQSKQSSLVFDPSWLAQKRQAYFDAKKDRMDQEELNSQLQVIFDELPHQNRLHILTGPPGAAKTVVAALWVKLAREMDPKIPVVLLTQEKPALHRIHEKLGFQEAVLMVLRDLTVGNIAIPQNAIVIIDEVGLLGTKTLAQVFEKLIPYNPVKILLIGDDKQLMPDEAGHPFRWLRENKKTPVSELLFPYRQKNPVLRQAVQDLYCEDIEKAFESISPFFLPKADLIKEAREIIEHFAPDKSMIVVHGDTFIQDRLRVLCPGYRVYSLAAAQGLATDQALLILAAPINLSECLVGISRARYDVTILVDTGIYRDREALLGALSSYPKSLMALDMISENDLLEIVDQA